MSGGVLDLTNPDDMPRVTVLDGTEVIAAADSSGNPIAIQTQVILDLIANTFTVSDAALDARVTQAESAITALEGVSPIFSGGTVYVSGVSVNGIPVGNDSTGTGTMAAPYLTPEVAIAAAPANSIVLHNGTTASPHSYTAASNYTVSKRLMLDSVVAFGATLKATSTTRIILVSASMTIGRILLDATSTAARCLDLAGNTTTLISVTGNGTKFLNWTDGAVYGGSTAIHALVSLTNPDFSSGACLSSVKFPAVAAGGLTINGGSFVLSQQNNSSIANIYFHATAAGPTVHISAPYIRSTAAATMAGSSYLRGIQIINVPNVYIGGADILCDVETNSSNVVSTSCIDVDSDTGGTPLDASGFLVENCTLFCTGSGGGYGVQIGYDGTPSDIEGLLQNGEIRGCNSQGSALAQAAFSHSYFISAQSNTKIHSCYGSAGDGIVLKECNGALVYSCVFANNVKDGVLLKGAVNTTVKHCTIIVPNVSGAGGIHLEANSAVNTTGAVLTGNIVYDLHDHVIGDASFVSVGDSSQTGTFSKNNYFAPTASAIVSGSWGYGSTNYSTLAGWQAIEPDATGLDPEFIQPSAGNYDLQPTSPMAGKVTANPKIVYDYMKRPFASPASVGAFERQ